MENNTRSVKVYVSLIIILAVLSAASLFLPQGDFLSMSDMDLPASRPVVALANAAIILVIYGGLGWLGLMLAGKLGFPEMLSANISNKDRYLTPLVAGAAMGLFFIIADTIFSRFHSLGPIPHPPFPTSLVASASAGIGEEIMFRLFFIPFWLWLVSSVILKGRFQNRLFWIVAVFSAFAFAAGHVPSLMMLFGAESVNDLPMVFLGEIVLLNGILSLFAAYYFRKYGFLAAVGIHFWTDVVWHVMWGLIQ